MSLTHQYSNLKKLIVQKAVQKCFSLQQVKDFFKASINSNRSLSRVIGLDCIFRLLEERAFLNERNVAALYSVGELLQSTEIKQYISVYSKIYLNESDPRYANCCLCCGSELFCNPSSEIPQNQRSDCNNNRNTIQFDELDEALRNITLNIGKEWKTLIRALDVDERSIDNICRNYPNDVVAQARAAFSIWRDLAKETASLLVLDKALENRNCKRRGIGLHLRKPVIGLIN